MNETIQSANRIEWENVPVLRGFSFDLPLLWISSVILSSCVKQHRYTTLDCCGAGENGEKLSKSLTTTDRATGSRKETSLRMWIYVSHLYTGHLSHEAAFSLSLSSSVSLCLSGWAWERVQVPRWLDPLPLATSATSPASRQLRLALSFSLSLSLSLSLSIRVQLVHTDVTSILVISYTQRHYVK